MTKNTIIASLLLTACNAGVASPANVATPPEATSPAEDLHPVIPQGYAASSVGTLAPSEHIRSPRDCIGLDTSDVALMAYCDAQANAVCDSMADDLHVMWHESPLSDTGFECVTDVPPFEACTDVEPSEGNGYLWKGYDDATYCVVPFMWGDVR